MTDDLTPPLAEYIAGLRREEPIVEATFVVTETVEGDIGEIPYTVENIGMKSGECEVWAKGTNETSDRERHTIGGGEEASGVLEIEGDTPGTEFQVLVTPIRNGEVAEDELVTTRVLSEPSDSYYDDEETIRDNYAGADDLFPSEREHRSGARRKDQTPIDRLKGLEQPEVKTSPIDAERDRFRDLVLRLEDAGEDLLYPFDREHIAGVRRQTPNRPSLTIADYEHSDGVLEIDVVNTGSWVARGPVWVEKHDSDGRTVEIVATDLELEPNASWSTTHDLNTAEITRIATLDDAVYIIESGDDEYVIHTSLLTGDGWPEPWPEEGRTHELGTMEELDRRLGLRASFSAITGSTAMVGNLRERDGETIDAFPNGLDTYEWGDADLWIEQSGNTIESSQELYDDGGETGNIISTIEFDEIEPGITYEFDFSMTPGDSTLSHEITCRYRVLGIEVRVMFFANDWVIWFDELAPVDPGEGNEYLMYRVHDSDGDTIFQGVPEDPYTSGSMGFMIERLFSGSLHSLGAGWSIDNHAPGGRSARYRWHDDALLFDEIDLEDVIEPEQWIECTFRNSSSSSYLTLTNLETGVSEQLDVGDHVPEVLDDEIGFLELAGWTLSEGDRVRDVSITVDGETESWSTADDFDEWEPGYHDGQQNQWEYVSDGDGYLELQTAPTEKSLRTTDVYFDPEESIEASFTAWTADERMSHSRLLLG